MIEWIVTSSILIAVIIALRHILKGKISLRLQYALWGLVLLRLLVPFSIGSSGFSVMNTVQKVPVVQDAESISNVDRIEHMTDGSVEGYYPSDFTGDFPTVVAESKTAEEYAHMEKVLSFRDAFVQIWLCGAAILFIVFAVSNGRFSSRLRRTRKPLEVKGSALPVYISNETDPPCLFGLFRPAIYLTPEASEDATILRHTVEHETTHFRHGDNFWSVLSGVCLAFHWYNPLVWWAAVLSRNDAELACDDATIRRIGEAERAEYGRTLIGMTCQKRPALLIAATTMTGSKRGIKERIMLIAKKPKMAVYTLIAVILAAAVATGCTFTGARVDTDSPWEWTNSVSIGNDDEAYFWVGSEEYSLTQEEKNTLADILNNIDEAAFTLNAENAGITPEYGLNIVFSGERHSINQADAAAGALEMNYEGQQWWVESSELESYIEQLKGRYTSATVDISVEMENDVPEASIEYAKDYITQRIDNYHEGWPEFASGCSVTAAKITGITQVNTGTAGLNTGVNLYLLEYRLRVDGNVDAVLVGGMSYEEIDGENWITEWSSVGQPYLLLYCDGSGTEPAWDRICVTNTDVIMQDYGTPEMLAQYGNAYTAAAIELYNKYLAAESASGAKNADSWSDADVERWSNEVTSAGFSIPTGDIADYDTVGREWAEAYVAQYVKNTSSDSPLHSERAAVLSSELYAESVLSSPKTVVYTMTFACDAANISGFERWFAGWAEPLDDSRYPEYVGWMGFGWYVVLQQGDDGAWRGTDAGTGGYGGWGYLNYEEEGVFDSYLEEVIAGGDGITAENMMRNLPFVDWREFDAQWGAKGWNALWKLLNDYCLTEGQVYGPEETRMWSDVYPDDQAYRNMYVILTGLNTDGAYAEGIGEILKKQRDYDQDLFDRCLQENLTLDQRSTINMLIGMQQ